MSGRPQETLPASGRPNGVFWPFCALLIAPSAVERATSTTRNVALQVLRANHNAILRSRHRGRVGFLEVGLREGVEVRAADEDLFGNLAGDVLQ